MLIRVIENNWQKIWNKRATNFDNLATLDDKTLILELKRLDGFDISSTIPVESFIEEYEETKKFLELCDEIKSVFEVGCGCGANLYMFKNLTKGGGNISWRYRLFGGADKYFKDRSDFGKSARVHLRRSEKYSYQN